MKSESEKTKDEFSSNIDEQQTEAMLQCNELQKRKLIFIQSKIEILKVVEMIKKSHQAFT